jgi:hypothetical protein
MKNFKVNLIQILFSIFLAIFNFSSKAQCTIDAGSDLFICVDKFGEIDTTLINSSFSGDSSLNYRWKCEYWYAGLTKFTASDFMDDTTALQANISNIEDINNEDEIIFILEAYDSSDVVHCTDSIVVTFSEFAALFLQTSVQVTQGDTTQISAISVGGIGDLDYSWAPNYNMSDSTIATPNVWPDSTTVYYCTVTDSVGCVSTYDDQFDVFVRAVSVSEIAKKNVKFTIYPNPINESTRVQTINLTNFRSYTYQITDTKGRLIKSNQLSSELNIGNAINSSGIYFFNVYYKDELIKVKKLIKR